MKRFISMAMFLSIAIPIYAQDLSIKGDGVKVVKVDKVVIVKEDATVIQSFPFTINAPPGAGLYFWASPAGFVFADRGDSLEVTSAPKGAATISVKSILPDLDKDGKFKGFLTKFYSVSFTVGDVPTPTPPIPVPPVPVPPTPDPAPIPLAGYRVLIIYEEKDKDQLPKDQFFALFGEPYREYFFTNCVKSPSGTPELRIFDKDINIAGAEKHWRDAFDRAKGKGVPYLIVSNSPKGGWEGLMPKTDAEIKAKLEAYK